jgi:8-oxo-dGTP diphosphatase
MRHLLRRLWFWASWPALYIYFHGTHRARAIVVAGDSLLLIQDRFTIWYDEGTWSVPGGSIDEGETAAQAAARELHEEVGLKVSVKALKSLGECKVSNHGLSYRAYYFLLELPAPKPLSIEHRELKTAQWFLRSTPPDALKDEARRALELLAQF